VNRRALACASLCGGMLFVALVMEHGFGMEPCPMCLMQRLWLFVSGLLACSGMAHQSRIHPLLTLLAALDGSWVAVQQMRLPGLPPDQVPSCGPPVDCMIANFSPLDTLSAMFFGTGDCAKVDSLLGISLPLRALPGFAGMIGLSVRQAHVVRGWL